MFQFQGASLVVAAYLSGDALSHHMWTDPSSVDFLVANFSQRVDNLLLLSYASDAAGRAADLSFLNGQLAASMQRLNLTSQQRDQWWKRTVFSTQSPSTWSDWPGQVLRAWTRPYKQVVVNASGAPATPRLDGFYGWLPLPTENASAPLVYGGSDPCNPTGALNGSTVLVGVPTECSFASAILAAQNAGAAGLLVYSNQADYLPEINCFTDADCNLPLSIPASTISQAGSQRAHDHQCRPSAGLCRPRATRCVTRSSRARSS